MRPTGFPVDDRDDRWGFGLGLSTDVDDCSVLGAQTVRKVLRLGRKREMRKAGAALAAAKVMPVSDSAFDALRALHPLASPPEVPAPPDPQVPTVKARDLGHVLRTMARGSAAGPFGLSVRHLQDLWNLGSLAEAVTSVVNRLMSGSVPVPVRGFAYGAKLFALEKKNGKPRPIACGDVFRRLAAKALVKDPRLKPALKLWRRVARWAWVSRPAWMPRWLS